MSANPPPQPSAPSSQAPQNASNIITALGNAFKSQNGDPLSGEHIAQLLIANMNQLGELAKQGKLTHQQIAQVRSAARTDWHEVALDVDRLSGLWLFQLKQYADKHKAATAAAQGTATTPQVRLVHLRHLRHPHLLTFHLV